jgi:hypothetical protein
LGVCVGGGAELWCTHAEVEGRQQLVLIAVLLCRVLLVSVPLVDGLCPPLRLVTHLLASPLLPPPPLPFPR